MAHTRSDRSVVRAFVAAIGAFAFAFAFAPRALAVEIFACEPEWAALARALAPQARVFSATHARQDPHHIEARPSLIAALRRADLAVCTGASLEEGWLPMLQRRSGNPATQDGRPGMFYAAQVVELARALPNADRSLGHVHAEGNPHFHLDPHRLQQVAAALAERLALIDAARATSYRERHAQWARDWQQRIRRWQTQAAPLRDRVVVAQHADFGYLWDWLGIHQIADLEPLPGMPPTVAHLQQVLDDVRAAPPGAIVQTLYQDPQSGRWLASRIGVPLLTLPSTVTQEPPSDDLAGLFDMLIERLIQALVPPPR